MKLFRVTDEKKIDIIEEHSYRDQEVGGFGETTLQELLTDYPEVIPTEEINSENPLKFVVIKREAGVTAGSMDLLLVDQNGVPTVVETKLIDNREIRRSVLAQGVEYLAYLKTEWNAERFFQEGQNFWSARNTDLETETMKRLGLPFDEDFSEKINSNISSNRMRLIIASDKIPPELKRIIEFLNDTSTFDVFGVEVRLFATKGSSYKILAPNLVGFTETTKERKLRTGTRWDHDRFFDVLENNSSPDVLTLARDLLYFGKEVSGREVEWGTGKERGSFTARLVVGKERFSLFSIYTNGQFSINIGWSGIRQKELGIDVSMQYRTRVKDDLQIDFDLQNWERGWPMGDMSMLLPNNVNSFKRLISDFVLDVKSVLGA